MNLNKNTCKLITWIGAAIAAISCFLPILSLDLGILGEYKITYLVTEAAGDSETNDGILVLILLVAAAVMIATKAGKFAFIPAVLGAIITIIDIGDISDEATDIIEMFGGKVHMYPLYICLIGCIAAAAGSLIILIKKLDKQD